MNIKTILAGSAFLSSVVICGCCNTSLKQNVSSEADVPFVVLSPNFEDGGELAKVFSCEDKAFGTGHSPELNWTEGPDGTHSYAIVFADTTLIDAGNTDYAYHWAIWNIPKNHRHLPAGIPGVFPEAPDRIVELPSTLLGAAHTQARGLKQFFGPCPSWLTYCTAGQAPLRQDRYSFTVYAIPNRVIEAFDYEPDQHPNYVFTLDAFFESIALSSTSISVTSSAKPISLPFPCPES